MNQWIQTIQDSSLSIEQRTHAAAHLWDNLRLAQTILKNYRGELTTLLQNEDSLVIETQDHYTHIQRDRTSLSVDHVSPEELKSHLGEDLYEHYIAHSHTIRWSRFKDAPSEIQEKVKHIATCKESIKITFQPKTK